MELILALLFGLNIGSFLNVCIARMPLDQSVVTPRSRCPKCKRMIAWYDNLPILSYLMLGARCRHCNRAISARYPAVEALTGVLSVLLALQYGFSVQWFLYLAFCSAIIVLVVIDLDTASCPMLSRSTECGLGSSRACIWHCRVLSWSACTGSSALR